MFGVAASSDPGFIFCACRYYFKMVCDDFDCGVIFEEISDEAAVLPLYEGKIIARVKKIE